MPGEITFGGVELTGDLRREPMETGRAESRSVRIGLIGDFRGRPRIRRRPSPPGRRAHAAPIRSRPRRRSARTARLDRRSPAPLSLR